MRLALLVILCSWSFSFFVFLYMYCEIFIFMDQCKFCFIYTNNVICGNLPMKLTDSIDFTEIHINLLTSSKASIHTGWQFYIHIGSTTKALTDKMCHLIICQPMMCHRESFQCPCGKKSWQEKSRFLTPWKKKYRT